MQGRTAFAIVLALAFDAATAAEPCNPVIDGTYCETQVRHPDAMPRSGPVQRPMQSLGNDLMMNRGDQPATLGAITFRGGASDCIGLMRRSSCK